MALDAINAKRKRHNFSIPHTSFNAALYRQPSLSEEEQQPEPYRTTSSKIPKVRNRKSTITSRGDGGSDAGGLAAAEAGLANGARPVVLKKDASNRVLLDKYLPISEEDCKMEDNRDMDEVIEDVLGESPEENSSEALLSHNGTTHQHNAEDVPPLISVDQERSPIVVSPL